MTRPCWRTSRSAVPATRRAEQRGGRVGTAEMAICILKGIRIGVGSARCALEITELGVPRGLFSEERALRLPTYDGFFCGEVLVQELVP